MKTFNQVTIYKSLLSYDKAFIETKMELCHSLSLLNAFEAARFSVFVVILDEWQQVEFSVLAQ